MKKIISYKNTLDKLAELGWEEKKTTKYIYKTLLPLHPIKKGFGKEKTGLLYKLGEGKDCILLRADIDGLKTQLGVRHICGHSSHTAALMSTLKETFYLSKKLTELDKSILFLFQPSEENFPSGAKAFLDEEKDKIPSIKSAFAAHVRPLLPLGTIGLKDGAIWARGDYMEITVKGHIAHIKDAYKGKDALEAAAMIILAVKKLQKKFVTKLRINIGVANGGLQANTIADSAFLKGDIRLKSDIQQKQIKKLLNNELSLIEDKTKTAIRLKYFDGYPVMVNDSLLTTRLYSVFKQKKWRVVTNNSLFSFGCEDFCFISNLLPSVMAFIGTGDKHDIHEASCTISNEGTKKIHEYFSEIVNWWINN